MILIDAIYINESGGKNLLDLLIDRFENKTTLNAADFLFLIDIRIKEFYINRVFHKIKVDFLKGSEIARYKYYKKNKQAFSKVFCFANVPPPIRLNCAVITYFHNILFLDSNLHKYFTLKNRFFFVIKRYIIKQRLNNTNSWIVQSKNVKELLGKNFKIKFDQILIIPIFNDETPLKIIKIDKKENAFFYPAIGVSHKNHDIILQAWKNLYQKGKLNCDLHLTIDKDVAEVLYSKINKLQIEGIPIINHGYLAKSEVENLYAKCKFVIHPSLGESFGLVLIEAIKNNCILLAPDLPYVNAIVRPNYYFDPLDANSIEEAIYKACNEKDMLISNIYVKSEIEYLVERLSIIQNNYNQKN